MDYGLVFALATPVAQSAANATKIISIEIFKRAKMEKLDFLRFLQFKFNFLANLSKNPESLAVVPLMSYLHHTDITYTSM